MPQERLQKIIAAAGIASRRKAEELITSGRVSVNGEVASELGSKADPAKDEIRIDGQILGGPERSVYILLNKPKGYVTTVSDPEGRPTVMKLIKSVAARVYPVGRLDYASEGLLLLTNDGALAQKLMHASSHVPKTYLVKISGRPSEEGIQRLRRGIVLPPLIRQQSERTMGQQSEATTRPQRAPFRLSRVGTRTRTGAKPVKTAPAKIEVVRDAVNPWYEVTLIEGRTRQIRRMFEEIGHHVEKIKRVRYGPLVLDVEPGHFRMLTPVEVARLKGERREQPRRSRKKSA
jgi:23S rRNA pseudouridine2605 synthase